MNMLYLSSEDIKLTFNYKQILEAVKSGLIEHSNEKIIVPARQHIHQKENSFLIMPAIDEHFYSTKLVNVCPENKRNGKAAIQGAIQLFSSVDGTHKATLEASSITALRTGAVGALGLDVISDESISTLGIIGTGEQAIYQVIFSAELRPIKKVYCYNRSSESFSVWLERVQALKPDVEFRWKDSPEEVVQSSDAIICATNATDSVFNASGLDLESKAFISVGSFKKDMQELPDELYNLTDFIILDSPQAKSEVGDIINALDRNYINESELILLGDVLAGKVKLDSEKYYVYKSVGMAAFDHALSKDIYMEALKKGIGRIL